MYCIENDYLQVGAIFLLISIIIIRGSSSWNNYAAKYVKELDYSKLHIYSGGRVWPHIQKLCEKLHNTRNNKELCYNLTIFEDQTLATV